MELDHVFVLVRPWRDRQGDAEAADELAASVDARDGDVPYPHTLYRPLYLPPDIGIPIARDVPIGEPLWFHLPFAPSGAERRAASPEQRPHPNGASRLLGVTIEQPAASGAVSAVIATRLGIDLRVGDAHRLTLRFDGGGRQGRPIVPHERLPVVIDG